MTGLWNNLTRNWQDAVAFVLGVWLVVSAWILGYSDLSAAFWNAVAFGVVMAAMALIALMEWHEWE